MDFIKHIYLSLSAVVKNMTASQMVLMVSLVAGVFIAGLLLFGVFRSVTYVTLYSDLENASASEVIDRLEEMNVPYRISGGGRAVKVPSSDVYKARIRLAALGLPKSGTIGYSIFDKTNLGMTDFLQKVNFRRALEGELARSVMELNGVDAARVHVVIPEERLFEEDNEPPTASVLIKLSTGSSLTQRQIRGVTHLIAASVEGLTIENISIVDYNGNLLTHSVGSDPVMELSGTQLEFRKNVERYLETKAQSLLDNSIGRGKSIVRITADMDFDQVEKTSETYDPDNIAIRSEERILETGEDASMNALDSTSARNSSTVENTITNYEVNKTVQHTVNSLGIIKKLTVAVLVDGRYETTTAKDGAEIVEYKPKNSDELDRITALVSNAIGYDTNRGDRIEVVNMQFESSGFLNEQKQLDEIATRTFYLDIGKKVIFVLVGLLLFFYGKKKVKRMFTAISRYIPPIPPPPTPTPPPEPSAVVQPQQSRLVDQMKKTAEDRPDEIARVIRTMMTE